MGILTPVGVVEEGVPGEGGRDGSGPWAADVGLSDHGLAVVGGVCVRGGTQLRRWGEALGVAGFPLQGPVGGQPGGERREQAGEPAWNALPSYGEWHGEVGGGWVAVLLGN